MKETLGDILSSYSGMLSDVLIGRYVQGKASPEEVRHLENLMSEDPFLADAIEGLMDGTWDIHEKNIAELNHSFSKKKPRAFKISVASVAVAASVLLVTYFGFNSSTFKKMEQASSEVQLSTEKEVEKQTHISILRESADSVVPNSKNEKIIEKDVAILPEKENKSESHQNQVDISQGERGNTLISISEKPAAPMAQKAANEDYKSAERNLSRNVGMTPNDDIELPTEEMAEPSLAKTAEAPAAKPKSDKVSEPKSQFVLLAHNTKSEIFDLQEVSINESKSKAKSKKALKSTADCMNCPDKEEIAEANAVGDTIASHKANELYESGVYAQAAKWYYRQSGVESKVMAGLSYLQVSDLKSCKMIEQELQKINVNAANYLKALRLYQEGDQGQSQLLFKKLAEGNSKFKPLAQKNLNVFSY